MNVFMMVGLQPKQMKKGKKEISVAPADDVYASLCLLPMCLLRLHIVTIDAFAFLTSLKFGICS
jgi:hypothetical protein